MGFRCFKVLVCLGVYFVTLNVNTAAMSTLGTLVTSRYYEKTTEAVTKLSSEKPVIPIKLTDMIVESEISFRYARTTVHARVMNPATKAQEANFRVLLPETAFISGFIMTIGDKSYKAYVKEKEEAKQLYDKAVSQGIGAAQVTATARDSNQFIVSVNVEPNDSTMFNLTYEELLVRRNGVYNHAINLYPGSLVPKLSVIVHIKETQRITELRVPALRTGNEIDASKDDAQNPISVIKRGLDDREANITFTPNLDQQKELMEIYANKTKLSQSLNTGEQSKTQDVLGQFVVQYDVDHSKHGEIWVNDGYFVHFFAPTSLPPLNKYVVFVLDTSGSMKGRKIIQLREAMNAILTDLHPGDFFSIVAFASAATVHHLIEDVDEDLEPIERPNQNTYFDAETLPPLSATPENIAKAKLTISKLNAAGGTNIIDALTTAVNLVQKRSEWNPTNINASTSLSSKDKIMVITDPVFIDLQRVQTIEPIIIFLTDGTPTMGETIPNVIINTVTEKNKGKDKASIYSLAFGDGAKREFLRRLSLRNDGFMRYIYEAADAALQLQDFYRQVSSPLLADVKFIYPDNQILKDTLTKNSFRTFYTGSEVVVAGQVAPDVKEVTPHVVAYCGIDGEFGKKRYEEQPQISIPDRKEGYLPLERLWSYLTIKQLLDKKDAADTCAFHCNNDTNNNDSTKKARSLALKYEFVTPLTSLVVVKPNATTVNVESVNELVESADTMNGPARHFASRPEATASSHHLDLDDTRSVPSALVNGNINVTGADATIFPICPVNGAVPPRQMGVSHRPSSFRIINGLTSPALFYDNQVVAAAHTMNSPARHLASKPEATASPYHLDGFIWAESLISSTADLIRIMSNGTVVQLKLSKDFNVPKKHDGDSPCKFAVGGGSGVCVYLTRCSSAKAITSDEYISMYCSVNDGYAGVCCSPAHVDEKIN